MENNVLSWGHILSTKTDLTIYAWQNEEIPVGKFSAVLDFKVWSKKVTGINCYFRIVDSGKLIRLTLFRMKDRSYRLDETGIDFLYCPAGDIYTIETTLNGKGNISFKNCLPQ